MKKPRKKKQKGQPQPEREERGSAREDSRAPLAGGGVQAIEDNTADDSFDPSLPETEEPTISRLALPILMVPLLGILVYFADMYLIDNSGKFSAMVYDPHLELPKPPGGPNQLEHGKMVYERKAACTACHQADGAGSAAQNAPPLAGSDWVLTEGPNRLIRIVLNGLSGPITVNGKPYNNTMLPWKDTLTDEDIAAVLTYIRQTWGNKAASVTPEQVKAVREATAARPSNWTGPELMRIPDAN